MIARSALIAIFLCGAWACNDNVQPVAASTIVPTSTVLHVYVTSPLIQPLEVVSVMMDGGSATDAVWTSSDTSIATVSRSLLTGVSPGDATITASLGGRTAATVVHIAWKSDTRLFLGSPAFFLDLGTRVTLFPALLQSSGRVQLDNRDVEWTTSDPSIARVDSPGALTTLAAGTTTLYGRFRGLFDSAAVEVGGAHSSFGYFYSGDAVITDADYYGETFWTPAPGKSFTTSGIVSANWEVPYATEPSLGWVGPGLPLQDGVMHVLSLDNVPCTAYVQSDTPSPVVNVGSPLVDCLYSSSPWESVRMEFVAFRPAEFSGTVATIYPNGPAVTTATGGITQTSVTTSSRSYAMPGVARDSVFWFVTLAAPPYPWNPDQWKIAGCRIAPTDGTLSQADLSVMCDPILAGSQGPLFYAVGFGTNARRGVVPIGFAQVSNGVVTRKAADGLDIATTPTVPGYTDVVVSGASLAAFDRVPAVLVTPIGLNSGMCGISEPVQSTPTTVKLTVKCTAGISGFTLGVIY